MSKSLTPPGRISPSCRWWLLAGLALFIIIALLCILVLVPAGVRALPGRYAARLPDFLQDLRRRPHPDLLPTPAIAVAPLTLLTPAPTALRLGGVTFATPTKGERTPTPTAPRPTNQPTLTSSAQQPTRAPTSTFPPSPT